VKSKFFSFWNLFGEGLKSTIPEIQEQGNKVGLPFLVQLLS